MKSLLSLLLVTLCFVSANAQYGGSTTSAAPNAYYVGAGAGALDNLGSNDPAYQFVAGKIWSFSNYFGIKTVAEATTDFSNAVLASALVGANYYPIARRFSPYVGAATGLGYSNGANSDNKLGFDLSSVVGVLLFRQSSLQLKVEGNANFLFRDVNGNMPMTIGGRVALLF